MAQEPLQGKVVQVYIEGVGYLGHFHANGDRLCIASEDVARSLSPQQLVDVMRSLIKRSAYGALQDPLSILARNVEEAGDMVQPSSIPGALEPTDRLNLIQPRLSYEPIGAINKAALAHDILVQELQERRGYNECLRYGVSYEERQNILAYFGASLLTDLSQEMWARWYQHKEKTDRVDAVLDRMNRQEWVMTADGLKTLEELDVEVPAQTTVTEEKPYHEEVFDKPWYADEGD